MKRLLLLLVMAFMTSVCVNAEVGNQTYAVALTQVSSDQTPQNPLKRDDKGRRQPGRHIECLIDRTAGVQFCNGATPQFMSYEVYDMDETPVATFLTESEFITYLFSHEGDFQIRLVVADCAYIGCVSL